MNISIGLSNSKNNFVDDLETKFLNSFNNKELNDLRTLNHNSFMNLDINFVNKVDSRYNIKKDKILYEYNKINSYELLSQGIELVNKSAENIKKLNNEIDKLKNEISLDLKVVTEFVDNLEAKLNVSKVKKDNPLGICILNLYQELKLFSSHVDFSDLNFEMKHQAKRLFKIKELENYIKRYNNHKGIYNAENTKNLINNLYIIIGEYLQVLSQTEFCYVKEAIKKMLSFDFNYINSFIPTYKIILNKVWNQDIAEGKSRIICNDELDEKLYVINNYNKDKYFKKGYVCELKKTFLINAKIDNIDIINLPILKNVEDIYELPFNVDPDTINIKAIYTREHNAKYDTLLPIVFY